MISFKFSEQTFHTQRLIGKCSSADGPTMVFFGGIHGNEPSGVIAIQHVMEEIERRRIPIHGHLIGIAGNLQALARNERFIDRDLNRIWTYEYTHRYRNPAHPADAEASNDAEVHEQDEIFEIIGPLLIDPDSSSENPTPSDTARVQPSYFLDLHTTSSQSDPFIAINDQLNNRTFALEFPVQTVLGIEEYLSGPLLSYLNDFGPVALAFEAGRHDDPRSVSIHAAFVWTALINAGLIKKSDLPDWEQHRDFLRQSSSMPPTIFEVFDRYAIETEEQFEMEPGFRNFSPVRRGDVLAQNRIGPIFAKRSGRVFMPLYQKSGDDGFFLVRPVPRWALTLSSLLRKFNFERLLVWLPGVSRAPGQADALLINKRVARFLANQLFHLLGYRRKLDNGKQMIVSRREIVH